MMQVFYNDEPSCIILIMWEICSLKHPSVIKGGKFHLNYRFYWYQIILQDSFTFQKYHKFDGEPTELVSGQNYPCILHPFPLFNDMGNVPQKKNDMGNGWPPPYHQSLCCICHGITSVQETTTSPVCVEGHFWHFFAPPPVFALPFSNPPLWPRFQA